MTIFNGGNSNLYSQFNFISSAIFFLFFIREKNYQANIQLIFRKSIVEFYLFIGFLLFLLFQILPLPLEFIKILSPVKFQYLIDLEYDKNYSSISLNPSNTFFTFLNFFSILIYLLIFKSLFYRSKDLLSFYFFIIILGGLCSGIGLYFYLIGNPDFLIFENSFYKNSSTSFFINRTVFSCFLVLCFFCGTEYLRLFDNYKKENTNNFFKKIHVRILIIFVTIGIITSFSKIGNFLLISFIFFYICKLLFEKEKKNSFFLKSLVLIVLVDILILGFYFGADKMIYRFSFLGEELSGYLPNTFEEQITRGSLTFFGYSKIKDFIFFGYGAGSFETLFKLNFPSLASYYADHAHSDIVEFLGEFGFIGFFLILSCIVISIIKNKLFYFKNLFLFYFFIILLIFDFTLHIPLIQLLLVILISMKIKDKKT